MKVSTGKAYEWLFPEKSKQTQRTSYQNQVLPYYVVPQKTVPLLSCSYYPTLQQLFEVFTVSRASQSKVLYCSIMSDNWNFPTCHYLSNNFQAFKPSGGQTHSFSTDLHSQSTRLCLLSSLTKLEQPWCVLIVIAAVSSIEDFSFFLSIFLLYPFPSLLISLCTDQTGRTSGWELREENDPDLWEKVVQKSRTED